MKNFLQKKTTLLQSFLVISLIEGFVCANKIISLPSESDQSVLFGLSISRLTLLGGLVGLIIFIGIGLFFASFLQKRLLETLQISGVRGFILGIAFITIWLTFFGEHHFGIYQVYFDRTKPLLIFFGLISTNVFLFELIYLYLYSHQNIIKEKLTQRVPVSFIIIFLILCILIISIATTGLGVRARSDFWGEAGSVLLGHQLIFLFVTAIFVIWILNLKGKSLKQKDTWIFLILWGLATGLWIYAEMPDNFFFPITPIEGMPRYPFSDAFAWDSNSHSVLIGEGFDSPYITQRPLYISYLVLLHLIGGESYTHMLIVQVIILSLIVPLLYQLGMQIHSRITGVLLATAYVILELNSIASTPYVQVTNSKVFMTESLTGLFILIILILFIRSSKTTDNKNWLYLSAGFLGLVVHTRLHTILLLIPVVLILLFQGIQEKQSGFPSIFRYAFLVLMLLTPWMFRNLAVFEEFSLEPGKFNTIMNNRWGGFELESYSSGKVQIPHITNTTTLQYFRNQRNLTIIEHFIHNEVLSILALPLNYEFQSIDNYYQEDFSFWSSSEIRLKNSEKIFLGFNLLCIATGLNASWKRFHWFGVAPLGFQLAYHLANALVRTSGWRYLKPVDWVMFLYFFIGLVEIVGFISYRIWGMKLFMPTSVKIHNKREMFFFNKDNFLLCFVGFFSIAVLVSMGSILVPQKYPLAERDQIFVQYKDEIALALSVTPEALVNDFLTSPDYQLHYGKILYPRYFFEHGLAYQKPMPYLDFDFPRYEFTILNARVYSGYIRSSFIDFIPQGSDALMLGCKQAYEIEVIALVVIDGDDYQIYIRDEAIDITCPLFTE